MTMPTLAEITNGQAEAGFVGIVTLILAIGGIILAFGRREGRQDEKLANVGRAVDDARAEAARIATETKAEIDLNRQRYHELAQPVTVHGAKIHVLEAGIVEIKGGMVSLEAKVEKGFERMSDALERQRTAGRD